MNNDAPTGRMQCKLCGWIHPAVTAKAVCVACGGPMGAFSPNFKGKTAFRQRSMRKYVSHFRVCFVCGRLEYATHNNSSKSTYRCKFCRGAATKQLYLRKDYPLLYNKVVSNLDQHPVTTEEWLAAIRYFDGCAFCESQNVDIRYYVWPFKKGGAYTKYNVVPICVKCSVPNVFNSLNAYYLKRVYKYFWGLVDEEVERLWMQQQT